MPVLTAPPSWLAPAPRGRFGRAAGAARDGDDAGRASVYHGS